MLQQTFWGFYFEKDHILAPPLHQDQHCHLGTKIPRTLPCLSTVPLATSERVTGKLMTRKRLPVRGALGKGENDSKADQVSTATVEMYKEQIYILINKTAICMTLEDVSAQRGSRVDRSSCGWVGGFYLMQMVERLRWHCETSSKTEVGVTLSVGQSPSQALGWCFLLFPESRM